MSFRIIYYLFQFFTLFFRQCRQPQQIHQINRITKHIYIQVTIAPLQIQLGLLLSIYQSMDRNLYSQSEQAFLVYFTRRVPVQTLRAKHRHRRAKLQTTSSCRLLNASPLPQSQMALQSLDCYHLVYYHNTIILNLFYNITIII